MHSTGGKVKDLGDGEEEGTEFVEAREVGAEEGWLDGSVDVEADAGGHGREEFDVVGLSVVCQ